MLKEHQEAVIELRTLQSSATWVRDPLLKGFDKMSSLAPSLYSVVDFIEGRVDAMAANGVHWGAGWH
jgi:hypothetical protein